MPTYSQLQAESYWNREIVTNEIDWLGDELCRRTKRPRVAFGSKGDNKHLRGSHRSQEWLLKSRYSTSKTYTVQSGLNATQARYIAGIDFTPGSESQMIAQCKRIYNAMRANQLNEVLEFYGNINGDKVVDGWNNIKNINASSDSSHLWHWHLSLDRKHCNNKKLMERILAIALGLKVEVPGVSAADVTTAMDADLPLRSPGVTKAAKDRGWGTSISSRLLAEYNFDTGLMLRDAVPVILANQQAMLGKDWVDEDKVVSGVLNGLGTKPLTDVASTLKAVFGERAAELAALLAE